MDGGESDDGNGRVEDGPFQGWSAWRNDPYENLAGPFYYRVEADGEVRCAFLAERRHMNGQGAMHGGLMMTFADYCLFAISQPLHASFGDGVSTVTVSLNGEFIGPAFEGEIVEGRGEVVRAGGSLIFIRGLVQTAGRPMLTFSGVIKKVRPRKTPIAPPVGDQ